MTMDLNLNLTQIFQGQYIVPLYQRNFAWRRDEIEQLLHDVYESFQSNPNGNYYIGSLVTLKRKDGVYEVIDGQQRLTTLSLITRMLGISQKKCLTYESRPEVDDFFNRFYKAEDNFYEALKDLDHPQVFHLKEAVGFISDIKDADEKICIMKIGQAFNNYLANNVILVRVEIPEDTDVASYFEIMNNRGVQLQKHEIIKARLLAKIDGNKERAEFAAIWDACSQMNIPIQKLFSKEKRIYYFGQGYDSIDVDAVFHTGLYGNNQEQTFLSIDEIISGSATNSAIQNGGSDDEDEDDNDDYNSIIDFPNFLMHVFRLYYNDQYKNGDDIPLNEKNLLLVYDIIEGGVDSKTFIKQLLLCRTMFDNYIPKTIPSANDEEDARKWTLRKPVRYPKTWKPTDTFGKDENGKSSANQQRVLQALTMLQVTFRSRINKNWLQELIQWLCVEQKGTAITYNAYIQKIDGFILRRYQEEFGDNELLNNTLEENKKMTVDNSYSEGTNTRHFLFTFIDYLYWVEHKTGDRHSVAYSKKLVDFNYKYWNSIEHHLAQNKAKDIKRSADYENNLGNLCLISKSANSSLSDRDVKEKVKMNEGKNLGAKRQIMYFMTKENNYDWEKEQIRQHYEDLLYLLSQRQEILSIK